MRSLWLCWALWALPLTGPGAAMTEEQILGSLLQQLHLSEVPILDQGDVESLVIPAHVRAQYVALLQRSHGTRSRGKRFSQNFREVAGRFLVSEASTHLLVFGMEQRLPPNSELVQAVLRLFQEPVPEAALRRHELLSPRSDRAQGNCDPEVPVTEGARCCRREMYIDLQGMKWAEHWVLEPPGFLAYECVGTCRQPPEPLSFKWPFLGPRQCIASETTSLPMIVSVKEGGRARAQVVSLPNMRVQKCSCASDGAPVPRKLEP
ncbi:left-right determination factor 1 [Pteropus alecto]|uniref:left-right determination factor 1 n=1 Tax=Pteropus alecto TaxID=9402 RepID=UPI0003F14269|nr:left-right determination factor 1 [Pteropus alecto]